MIKEKIEYTHKQNVFIEEVKAGKNVFLTGKAGTGKSLVTRDVMQLLKLLGKKTVAVAPTGIAANNVNGVTIHSLFSIRPYGVLNMEACQFMSSGKRELLRKVDVIIIDEVSMLRPDILDAIHWTLKKNGLAGLDKRQVIFVGDLAQLPPILDDNERTVLYSSYDGETFTYAKIYQQLNVGVIDLDEVKRQNDIEFITALNLIREGKKSEYFRQFLSKQASGVILAPYNATVKAYNEAGLKAQPGEVYKFRAKIDGEVKPEDFNFEREVCVKEGCKIMYLVNSKDNPLRNGTLGTFHTERGKYFFRLGNIDYALERVVQTKKKYIYKKETDSLELEEIGSIEQMPIKLAYALSIHKSQGLTFDEVTVDLSRPCFQPGQMYVALSRVTTPQGLKILA